MIEMLLLIVKAYLAVGIFLGIISIFVSTSSGFKEFLDEEYPDEEWGWKDDIIFTAEAVFLWPLVLWGLLRKDQDCVAHRIKLLETRAEAAEALLATARRDVLKEAAQLVDEMQRRRQVVWPKDIRDLIAQ